MYWYRDDAQVTRETCNAAWRQRGKTEPGKATWPLVECLAATMSCKGNGNHCCVVDCNFSYKNSPGVSLFTFPRKSGPSYRTAIFQGYDSLTGNEVLHFSMCGVTSQVFALLLSILKHSSYRSYELRAEDKLTLFLMKLKMGDFI